MRHPSETQKRARELKQRYRERFDKLEQIFFDQDPVGIAYLKDEYEPEVARLLPRLETFTTTAELTAAIHAIFVEMFDAEIAGPRSRYEAISLAIWSEVLGR